jgi:hypothetical protein
MGPSAAAARFIESPGAALVDEATGVWLWTTKRLTAVAKVLTVTVTVTAM